MNLISNTSRNRSFMTIILRHYLVAPDLILGTLGEAPVGAQVFIAVPEDEIFGITKAEILARLDKTLVIVKFVAKDCLNLALPSDYPCIIRVPPKEGKDSLASAVNVALTTHRKAKV